MPTSKSQRRLDGLDAEILLSLIEDPDATTVALAHRLSVSRNTVQARLQKLSDGVLDSFQRRITPRALGYEVTAFMNASIRQGYDKETMEALSEIPEIIEIFATTGDADLRLTFQALCGRRPQWCCANSSDIAPNRYSNGLPTRIRRRARTLRGWSTRKSNRPG